MNTIRNFCIIAHIDHGKSTLADRFLELTRTVERRKMREQFLDQMDLEREKGITIKMQPVRMLWHPGGPERSEGQDYILNLIDTPGHADFSYEVSRSLAAVEGAILLVDATKGVQAQTLANLHHARKQNLVILPVVNKIDSPLARVPEVTKEIAELLQIAESDIFHVSAKDGTNVELLLNAVAEKIPAPRGSDSSPLRALIFDSKYDTYKGIIAYVRLFDGTVSRDDQIVLLGTGAEGFVKEVGHFFPQETPVAALRAGEIGYIATGIKDSEKIRIGDTITLVKRKAAALPGYQTPKPMVFVSFYPQDPNQFNALKDALAKLRLNDPSFTCEMEAKEALGRGFRCGFLGVLHSEIISERIQREFHIDVVISRPSVEYTVVDKKGKRLAVQTPSDWPEPHMIEECYEPVAKLEIIAPIEFFSQVLKLVEEFHGRQAETKYIGENKLLLVYEVALREIVGDLHDALKSATQGLASMDYEIKEQRKADLVKLDILIAGRPEEALSTIAPRQNAQKEGKMIVEKLKEVLPPQQYDVPLQAAIGGKVIARETITARRKDVTAPLYGGDVTRKRKLLEKQKKGKKELKEKGRIAIPSRVFLEIFRK